MQTLSRVLVCAVLACLLLSWASGVGQPLYRTHAHKRGCRGPHHVLARLRRSGGNNPVHHPVRPCKNAVLPPDDDDNVDREDTHANDHHERFLSLGRDPSHRSHFAAFGSRPLPTGVPLHQTLCILLI
jgi:hypothetical protein